MNYLRDLPFFFRVTFPRLLGFLVLSAGLMSCWPGKNTGILKVSAPKEGFYEIFRVSSQSPLQLESEQMGAFNEDTQLRTGTYLVLADCSSATVIIHQGRKQELAAIQVDFIPPFQPVDGDRFPVQCSRYESMRSRQSTHNQFSFFVLEGHREMLVGMLPLPLDLSPSSLAGKKRLEYTLSALRVDRQEGETIRVPYFVSPPNSRASITEAQSFGLWEFLMPGDYNVEVNGTSLLTKLEQGGSRSIVPARIKLATPQSQTEPKKASSSDQASRSLFEINQSHWLNLDETYYVLPGKVNLRLANSRKTHEVELKEGELYSRTLRSVLIEQGCLKDDWVCIGSKKIQLFEEGQFYAFSEGVSDDPVYFMEENVLVGIEGGRDIRYRITSGEKQIKLRMGKVLIKPVASIRNGFVTDLLRVEAGRGNVGGVSLDLSMDRPTEMSLFEGYYTLASFSGAVSADAERRKASADFFVSYGKTVEVQMMVYVNERKPVTPKKSATATQNSTRL